MRMKVVLIVLLSICLACGVAFGGAANYVTGDQDQVVAYKSKIPNATQQDEDVNGRPQHMDTDDRDAEQLNSVERRIISRDTVISNAPALVNRSGE